MRGLSQRKAKNHYSRSNLRSTYSVLRTNPNHQREGNEAAEEGRVRVTDSGDLYDEVGVIEFSALSLSDSHD